MSDIQNRVYANIIQGCLVSNEVEGIKKGRQKGNDIEF